MQQIAPFIISNRRRPRQRRRASASFVFRPPRRPRSLQPDTCPPWASRNNRRHGPTNAATVVAVLCRSFYTCAISGKGVSPYNYLRLPTDVARFSSSCFLWFAYHSRTAFLLFANSVCASLKSASRLAILDFISSTSRSNRCNSGSLYGVIQPFRCHPKGRRR